MHWRVTRGSEHRISSFDRTCCLFFLHFVTSWDGTSFLVDDGDMMTCDPPPRRDLVLKLGLTGPEGFGTPSSAFCRMLVAQRQGCEGM